MICTRQIYGFLLGKKTEQVLSDCGFSGKQSLGVFKSNNFIKKSALCVCGCVCVRNIDFKVTNDSEVKTFIDLVSIENPDL